MTKRILHIIPSLDRAGAEKQLALLAAGLPRARFEVHVCALTRGGPIEGDLAAAGVPVTVIGKRFRIDPLAYWRLRRHIAQLRPDLVQTWLFAGNAYGRAAALACGVPRIVASERCVDPWKSALQLAIDRRLARRTDRLVANSPAVRDFYVERGVSAAQIVVIPNGVPPAAPPRLTREAILAQLGLPSHVRLVAFIGRFWRQKRIKDAIWAIDLLKVVRDDVHLLVFGDGPLRRRMERFRRQARIVDKVHFLGQRNDVGDWLPHCDLLLSTSGYEGQSNAVLEAMAAGLSVVATDIPGTRDLVVPGETGLLAPVGGRGELARGLQRLLNDRPLAAQFGAAGRRRVETEFSVERMVGAYAELYDRLLGP